MRCKSIHSASIQFWKWDAFFWRWEVEDILQAYWSKDNLLKLRAGSSSSSDLVRYTSKESPYTARDVTRSSHIRTLPSSSKSQFFSSSIIFWTLEKRPSVPPFTVIDLTLNAKNPISWIKSRILERGSQSREIEMKEFQKLFDSNSSFKTFYRIQKCTKIWKFHWQIQ